VSLCASRNVQAALDHERRGHDDYGGRNLRGRTLPRGRLKQETQAGVRPAQIITVR